ncbi:unnamed protein product, partial [Ectocarpus sp. 12 AP-2014]
DSRAARGRSQDPEPRARERRHRGQEGRPIGRVSLGPRHCQDHGGAPPGARRTAAGPGRGGVQVGLFKTDYVIGALKKVVAFQGVAHVFIEGSVSSVSVGRETCSRMETGAGGSDGHWLLGGKKSGGKPLGFGARDFPAWTDFGRLARLVRYKHACSSTTETF